MYELTSDELTWLAPLELGALYLVKAVDSALTNQVFLLEYNNNQRYIFKRLNGAARSAEDREREFLVQQLAHQHGLSVKILATNSQYRLQEYIHGKSLSLNNNTSLCVEILASQLNKIHQLPAIYAPIQDLFGQLEVLYKKLNHSVNQSLFSQYLQLAKQLDLESECDTLCHGDLSMNNLLLDNIEQVKVIDWEYSVLACPAYDLASCIAINEFNDSQIMHLIKSYYSLNNKSSSRSLAKFSADIQSYLSVFAYLNQLWSGCFLDN